MHDLADVGEDRLWPGLERRDLAATGELFGDHRRQLTFRREREATCLGKPVPATARPARCYAARGRRVKAVSLTLALTPNPLSRRRQERGLITLSGFLPSPRSEGRRAGDEGFRREIPACLGSPAADRHC